MLTGCGYCEYHITQCQIETLTMLSGLSSAYCECQITTKGQTKGKFKI